MANHYRWRKLTICEIVDTSYCNITPKCSKMDTLLIKKNRGDISLQVQYITNLINLLKLT